MPAGRPQWCVAGARGVRTAPTGTGGAPPGRVFRVSARSVALNKHANVVGGHRARGGHVDRSSLPVKLRLRHIPAAVQPPQVGDRAKIRLLAYEHPERACGQRPGSPALACRSPSTSIGCLSTPPGSTRSRSCSASGNGRRAPPNDFDSTDHVRQRIRAFFTDRNRRAPPIRWIHTAQKLLAKVRHHPRLAVTG